MENTTRPQFELIAGHPALDFVNTLGNRPDPSLHQENIRTLDDLLGWAEMAGILSARDRSSSPPVSPRSAARLVEQAIELREVIHRILAALIADRAPASGDIDILNGFLTEAMQSRYIARDGRRLRWDSSATPPPERVLHAITRYAAGLFTSEAMAQVRECDAPHCRWMFLDTSKNHRRRWCDMKVCGNREKARRFYAANRS
jgi:predicted RNA-binding Zn ribbon-like protein